MRLRKKTWRFIIITFEICCLLIFKIFFLLGNYCPLTTQFVKEEADTLITRFLKTCLGSRCLQRTYSPLSCLVSSTNNKNSKESSKGIIRSWKHAYLIVTTTHKLHLLEITLSSCLLNYTRATSGALMWHSVLETDQVNRICELFM